MAFLVTTTGTEFLGKPSFPISGIVILEDVGYRQLPHPTTNLDLELEFSVDELNDSDDLWTAIENGWLSAVNENGVDLTQPGQSVGSHPIEQHSNASITSKVAPEVNTSLSGMQTGSNITWNGNNWIATPTSYRHKQNVASATWNVTHNLGRFPSGISVVDSAGTLVEGDVTLIDENTMTIQFSAVFSGTAYIS